MRTPILASALLVLVLARAQLPAQFYPQQQFYAPNVVVTPPPFIEGGAGGGDPLPFDTQQMQQQRLLEMLDTGGLERPAPTATPPGCVHAGQVYSEGAMVGSEGGDPQGCGPRPGARPDLNGHVPLAWQPAPGG